jgi:hypothetical protein
MPTIPDVQQTAERMYTRYKTFALAIEAAVDFKQGHQRATAGYIFWDAVILMLQAARKRLGLGVK